MCRTRHSAEPVAVLPCVVHVPRRSRGTGPYDPAAVLPEKGALSGELQGDCFHPVVVHR